MSNTETPAPKASHKPAPPICIQDGVKKWFKGAASQMEACKDFSVGKTAVKTKQLSGWLKQLDVPGHEIAKILPVYRVYRQGLSEGFTSDQDVLSLVDPAKADEMAAKEREAADKREETKALKALPPLELATMAFRQALLAAIDAGVDVHAVVAEKAPKAPKAPKVPKSPKAPKTPVTQSPEAQPAAAQAA